MYRFYKNFALVKVWTDSNFKALKDRKWRSFLRLTAVKGLAGGQLTGGSAFLEAPNSLLCLIVEMFYGRLADYSQAFR